MNSGIFVSYRRQDVPMAAGRLADDLKEVFGERQIFRDVETIEPGEDFVEVLGRALDACAVMLAIIGPNWLTLTDGRSRRRIDDPHDWTRLEVSAALARNIRVVPVLVEGSTMPEPDQLPEDLKGLARRQALEVSDKNWKTDVGKLVAVIEKILPAVVRKPASGDKGYRKIALGAGAALGVVLLAGYFYGESGAPQPAAVVPTPVQIQQTATAPDYSGVWSDGMPGKDIVFRQSGNALDVMVSFNNVQIGRGAGTVAGNRVSIQHDDWSAGAPIRHNCQFTATPDGRRMFGPCLNMAAGLSVAVTIYR